MNAGLIGGLIGCAIGLMGGLLGTYATIHNTNGPRERRFTIRASLVGWLLGALFLAGLFLLSSPYRYLLWIPYGILLPLGIRYWNREQMRIRQEEAQAAGGSGPIS
jgi:hypothetical protein